MPAGDIERLVEERLIAFLRDGGELHGALAERISQAHEIETLIAEASSLAKRWPRMPSAQKRQRLQGLIARITLKPEVRSQLRAFVTFLGSNAELYCDPFGCWTYEDPVNFSQFEISTGLIIRL